MILSFLKKKKSVAKKERAVQKRERLTLLQAIKTDHAEYLVYETQTLQGTDCVNIEIERVDISGKKKLVLEQEIFDGSWGAMGGEAFSSLIIDALNNLRYFIKKNGEFIIYEIKVDEHGRKI